MIKECHKCGSKPHTQDQLHGKGQRVHNVFQNKNKASVYRCTVCGHEETKGGEKKS